MDNPFKSDVHSNLDIDKSLHDLPGQVSQALEEWLKADLALEEKEASLFAEIKILNPEASVEQIKSMIRVNKQRHDLAVAVIMARTNYKLMNERLMAIKKQASMNGPR